MRRLILVVGAVALSSAAQAQTVLTNSDGTIRNSLCVGFDCGSESFGADTIRLKENNLRIHFEDTSTIGGFPSNDWRIVVNDQSSGGANKFSIEDSTGGRTPFTILAGARSNALFVDAAGEVGIGTSTPVAEVHAVRGDTPTVRLQQDGSSGFAPQTWDMAGNETSFFIRDASNGSTLPFRIFPGASSQSLVIDSDDDVGVGAGTNPDASLHVRRSNGTAQLHVEETGGAAAGNTLMLLESNQRPQFRFTNGGVVAGQSDTWVFDFANTGSFFITAAGTGVAEMSIDQSGNMVIQGSLTANGSTFPDYVFNDDYKLMPLGDLRNFVETNKHLPSIPSAREVTAQGGHNMTELQIKLLEKVEELTLYTLDQEERLNQLARENAELRAQLSSISAR